MAEKRLTREEYKEAWAKWNAKRDEQWMDPVRLEKHGVLHFRAVQMSENDPFAAIQEEIDTYQQFVDEVLDGAAKLSDECSDLMDEVNDICGEVMKAGLKTGSVLTMAAGAVVSFGAAMYDDYKQRKIREERDRKMAELQIQKKQIATEKLKNLHERYTNFNKTVLSKVGTLYNKELKKSIEAEDPDMNMKIDLFKRSFCMYIKSNYLSEILWFVIQEMEAWKAGKQYADRNPKPKLETIVAVEVDKWKQEWTYNVMSLAEWFNELIYTENDSYDIAALLILKEPYLLKEYAGVQSVDDLLNKRPAAVTELSSEVGSVYFGLPANKATVKEPILSLLNHNDYYKDCKQFMEKYSTHKLKSFSFVDAIIFAIAVAAGICIGFGFDVLMYGCASLIKEGSVIASFFVMIIAFGILWFIYWLCGKVVKLYSPILDYKDFMKKTAAEEQSYRKKLSEKYNII